MSQNFKTIALIGKQGSTEVTESLSALSDFLRSRGVRVLDGRGADEDADFAEDGEIGAEADAAVVVGGDGTMLNVARRLAGYGVPLVGVNLGRLGFMTDIARQDMIQGVEQLLAGRFVPEKRLLLDAGVWREGARVFSSLAFNDVVVSKGEAGRMIELEVRVDDEFLQVLRADGMIVATPTGSTAYALSANGPILHPKVAGIALVPLCPHALSNRPITLSDQSRVDLLPVAPYDGRVHCDGFARFEVRAGDSVRVERSEHSVTLLHPPGYSYFAMLREKLHWSAAPRRRD